MIATVAAKVAVVGSRDYPRPEDVDRFVGRFAIGTVVVSGGARGVDTWAAQAAERRGLPKALELKPDYARHGRFLAPILRNTAIVETADYVVGFWTGQSMGTLDALVKALDAGKLFRVYVAADKEQAPTRYSAGAFAEAFHSQITAARQRRLLREGF
jgi:hypothetical protein